MRKQRRMLSSTDKRFRGVYEKHCKLWVNQMMPNIEELLMTVFRLGKTGMEENKFRTFIKKKLSAEQPGGNEADSGVG